MSTSKIQAAASALRNTRGLPWPKTYEHKVNEDLLDWLQAMFGFQERQSIFFVGYCMIYIVYVGFSQFTFCSLIFCQLLTCRQIVFQIRGNIWFYFLLTYIYEQIRRLINNPRFCSVNIQPLSWSGLKILTSLLVSQHLCFFCSCWCSFYFLWNLPLPFTWFLLQLDDNALNDVMKRLFKNYKKWCKYLGRKSSLWWLS